jgi:hypothetical protein
LSKFNEDFALNRQLAEATLNFLQTKIAADFGDMITHLVANCKNYVRH